MYSKYNTDCPNGNFTCIKYKRTLQSISEHPQKIERMLTIREIKPKKINNINTNNIVTNTQIKPKKNIIATITLALTCHNKNDDDNKNDDKVLNLSDLSQPLPMCYQLTNAFTYDDMKTNLKRERLDRKKMIAKHNKELKLNLPKLTIE